MFAKIIAKELTVRRALGSLCVVLSSAMLSGCGASEASSASSSSTAGTASPSDTAAAQTSSSVNSVTASAVSSASSAAANRSPTISGVPLVSVPAGSKYSFLPSGSDPDGNALTFAIANKPSWATFNVATGLLTGTPGSVNKGTYSSITISVSDGHGGTAKLSPFTLAVTNTKPTIAGNPATSAVIGSAYSFTPTAADANGDTLAFSIANKPSWATFNTLTGALTGKPTSGGSRSGIVITATDSSAATASLQAFAINVVAPTSGSATLSWIAPTQNSDGSFMTDLVGYTIYYGTSSSTLSNSIAISTSALAKYTVTGLTPGLTYYFAITANNASGTESAHSSVVSGTI